MSTQNIDEFYMKKALRLAMRGAGYVSPNPMVGCVIVKNGEVVTSGYHVRYGGNHAEIAAMEKCKKSLLRGSTIYINLEPCCHVGKTPPCADAIIQAAPRRVVIGMQDPNPLVDGRSIAKLQRAGIDVACGVLQDASESLNEVFIKYVRTGMPFVVLKVAMSMDGMIAAKRRHKTRLSSPETDRFVHSLRAKYDAVLVGINTVLIDNPHLGCRLTQGRDPVRIVLDTYGKTPMSSNVMRDNNVRIEKNTKNLHSLMKRLGQSGISSILIEGGAKIFTAFLNQKLVDKVYCFVAPRTIASATSVPAFTKELSRNMRLYRTDVRYIGKDLCITGYPAYAEINGRADRD